MDWTRNRRPGRNVLELAGLTPMVHLDRLYGSLGMEIEVLAKLEMLNPSGSLKDRVLAYVLREAMGRGELRPGMSIIEATTGNTGIATAMAGAILGYPVTIVMPRGMSDERKKTIGAYGAELVFTEGGESDVDLALARVREIMDREPGRYFEVRQFSNPDNVAAHYATTGPEIWEQAGGRVDIFVSAQGTGGTLSGVARFLRERDPKVVIAAVEPSECPVLSEGRWGRHGIEGIGDGFVPDNLDVELLDAVVQVSTGEAVEWARRLARLEGIFAGISSGCNLAAVAKLVPHYPEARRLVTVINDNGQRYLTTPLCGEHKTLAALAERCEMPSHVSRGAPRALVVK